MQVLSPSLNRSSRMFPVEVFQNTLATIAAILRQIHVRFHLTGGVTSVLYGEPRMTQDLDVVVDKGHVSTV